MRNIVSPLDGFASPFGRADTGLRFLFANGEAGASWNVLGYSVIGEAITSITDSSGNDISLANAVTAQQPAYDETEDGIKYAFFDLDDSLSATLPDLGADASKWTVTPYAVHVDTGQTIGAGSYTAPTNDWGAHGVIDREVTATEINRLVHWAKRNKLTGVDYPTLKTRMDVICMNAVDVAVDAPRVIVAEAAAVKIYDASDPTLPLEKTFDFTGYTVSSVSALDGTLIVGTGSGVSVLDIDTDTTVAIDYSTATSPAIVNNSVNSVAMTVLSGDTEPTIAVGTDGGVSVIKADGTVVDVTFVAGRNYVHTVDFTAEGWVFATTSNVPSPAGWFPVLFEIPNSDASGVGTSTGGNGIGFTYINTPYVGSSAFEAGTDAIVAGQTLLVGKAVGFWQIPVVHDDALSASSANMVAHITSTYNTGWMVGDVKGCWLCDTDDSDLVGALHLDDDFTGYADQAAAEAAGYVFSGATFDAANDQIDFGATNDIVQLSSALTGLSVGDHVIVEVVTSGRTGGALAFQNNFSSLSAMDGSSITGDGTRYFSFTVAGSLRFIAANNFDGSIDSITIYPATPDRSVNGKGLKIVGNISVDPVADGAELVWYTFGADCTVDLGSDITSSGSMVWLEKIGGEAVHHVLNYDGSDSYVDGEVGTPPTTGVEISGTTLTFKAGATLANVRPSGTPTSLAQATKSYNDEIALCQPKAAATLAGSGDAVTALAHDPTTGVLRASQSDKTSLFIGLERVGEEDGKSTCIAASNGIVAGI